MCFHVRSKLQMMRRPTTTQASPKINLHLVTEILIVLPNSIFVYLIKTHIRLQPPRLPNISHYT